MKIIVRCPRAEVEVDLPNQKSGYGDHVKGLINVLEKVIEQINKLEQ